jgi:hypothetical protein
MNRTYEAILHGDHLEWTGEVPELIAGKPVRVQVTLVDSPATWVDTPERRRMRVEALRALRASNPFAEIADSVAWQRAIRQDRPLPGREP